jgi:hypothetical protein
MTPPESSITAMLPIVAIGNREPLFRRCRESISGAHGGVAAVQEKLFLTSCGMRATLRWGAVSRPARQAARPAKKPRGG